MTLIASVHPTVPAGVVSAIRSTCLLPVGPTLPQFTGLPSMSATDVMGARTLAESAANVDGADGMTTATGPDTTGAPAQAAVSPTVASIRPPVSNRAERAPTRDSSSSGQMPGPPHLASDR